VLLLFFVDVDKDTLMVTPRAVEEKISPKTRAIIPVHYAGAPVDLNPLRALAVKHGIPLIEDAAHSIGTSYRGKDDRLIRDCNFFFSPY